MVGKISCWVGCHLWEQLKEERTIWETVLKMDRFGYKIGQRNQRAVTLVLELKLFSGSVSKWCGLVRRISIIPGRNCVCLACYCLKGVLRNRSRPPRGAVCSLAQCFKMLGVK